ncbi:13167_t:CDS:2 [Entrophospora sp. SA101]|nr:13167_t:CDS:2 [Entrophospora sp. SA101]
MNFEEAVAGGVDIVSVLGAKVIACCGSGEQLEIARKYGAE